MLGRLVLVAIAVVELLFPRQLVDFWMDLASERDEGVELRPWVYTVTRVEGLAILVWVLSRVRHERA